MRIEISFRKCPYCYQRTIHQRSCRVAHFRNNLKYDYYAWLYEEWFWNKPKDYHRGKYIILSEKEFNRPIK